MKKTIRLTEDDLTRLVKRVIKEQVEEMDEQAALPPNVKRLVDDVKNNRLTTSDLTTALMFLKRPNPKQTSPGVKPTSPTSRMPVR
jgi:hypothetical protein